jgi:hypothetical protein
METMYIEYKGLQVPVTEAIALHLVLSYLEENNAPQGLIDKIQHMAKHKDYFAIDELDRDVNAAKAILDLMEPNKLYNAEYIRHLALNNKIYKVNPNKIMDILVHSDKVIKIKNKNDTVKYHKKE